MATDQDRATEILVIGGGPAGTTAATLLARAGHAVTLVEKDCHPRFHIGESLLPMNLPILERLGVLDQVRAVGVRKLGADFTCNDQLEEYQTYLFSRALGGCADHAFEVTRSEFDQLLFEHCRRTGVTTLEQTRVTEVDLDPDGRHRVVTRDSVGHNTTWRPGFLVDASGRDTVLAGRNGWKSRNPRHASAAVFGHFHGVSRRPEPCSGNISVYWFPHGWIWMIPLRDGVMSVGAVCWPEYLKTRQTDLDAFLVQTLRACPPAWARMRNARPALPARATGNYSYRSSRLCGPGYVLVGDAFAFIDPVFSSGVYLAMNSAEQAVPLAQAWLRGDRQRYQHQARSYEKEIGRGLSSFSWFIHRFTSPAMRNLFRAPRNVWQVEQAVISMLAGDVFRRGPIFRRLILFRLLYAISWVLSWRESLAAWRQRMRNARMDEIPGA